MTITPTLRPWRPAVRGDDTGDLILPNGSVHHGDFKDGRASGPGVLYDAAGTVTTGSWLNNKRLGAFITIDPKGGEWADVYNEEGKRTSRKKRAPPPDEGFGAQPCKHCGVKFHLMHNSCCRQHEGKWMQATSETDDAGVVTSSIDLTEFPQGGIWLCCGSKRKEGGDMCCKLGLHAVADAVTEGERTTDDVRLSRNAAGEVVITSARRPVGDKWEERRAAALKARPEDWRIRARDCVLCDQPFRGEDDLVRLDTEQHETLMSLASLAECGRTGCACTRVLHPGVRKRFREEVVRRASAARQVGSLPASGHISYVSFGSGLLLGDLDVICGLQQAGFTIVAAAFIDIDYRENGHAALAELDEYLAPEGRAVHFTSAAEYVVARLEGRQPAAHIFAQIDSDDIPSEEALSLSAIALTADGGLGFRLANKHHPTLLPIVTWRRTAAAAPASIATAPDALSPPGAAPTTATVIATAVAAPESPPRAFPAAPPNVTDVALVSTATEAPTPTMHAQLDEAFQKLEVSQSYSDVLTRVDAMSLITVDEEPVTM